MSISRISLCLAISLLADAIAGAVYSEVQGATAHGRAAGSSMPSTRLLKCV
jgi:hypothetical protein